MDELLIVEAEKQKAKDDELAKKTEEIANLSVAKQSAEFEVAELTEKLKMQLDKAEAEEQKAIERRLL